MHDALRRAFPRMIFLGAHILQEKKPLPQASEPGCSPRSGLQVSRNMEFRSFFVISEKCRMPARPVRWALTSMMLQSRGSVPVTLIS